MKKKKKGFLLAFPAISGFLFFYLIPFLIVLWYSVSFGIGKREFVGLDNYKELFKNTMFLLAVKNTCKYMLVTIPVTLGTALCISVILQQITKGQKIFRLSFLYPIIMPIASIVLVIQFFFKNNGFLNLILNFFYLPEKDWLRLLETGYDGRLYQVKAEETENLPDTFSIENAYFSSPESLLIFLEDLIRGQYGNIFRAKGQILAGSQWFQFDVADSRYGITGCEPQKTGKAVFIGTEIHRQPIRRVVLSKMIQKKIVVKKR
mgnify:CR=1 FL=1